ncbi:minor tail protein [Gordonia phage Strosahl]|uniref:Minor tail protein n=4 Tax=Soupsvirus TaxID=1982562 RepID=A0A1B3B141_9CAUD|nr:minor tail protein [Gordonia phage Soups]YP_009281640.1 minor tail protein [Gordonia phage Remus]YP_009285970.1 minor tail protein [Gordonia phage JSwag]YP_009596230.1 minor tail protein [Gordonia phage Strosahl]YP_009624544.1 minor tail protein [Gordonia phage Waits]ASZ73906.1 minor tail protein [Gordonia phage ShayRa]AXH47827.1 minor tail protein [Gordonia phage LastResort]QDM56205.1 minor tail protein [Gordonia phage ReMo]QFP95094.1 minor tail protein [Gordonia phage MinecraftSteve]Q
MLDTVVELEGVNGERFNLTTGDRGIYLDTDPSGLYDPPVKVVYEEPGNFPGARYLSHRILRRDVVFGVIILNDGDFGPSSWLSRDSEWRKAWAFDRDCKLYITTPNSGTRYLKLRLGEQMDISLITDPRGNTLNTAIVSAIAGDPFWYEDDVHYSVETTTDTSFTPSTPVAQRPKETLYLDVDPIDGRGGLNPTDQYIFPTWTVPGSTVPYPTIGGEPNWAQARTTVITLPDYSFEDPEFENRRLQLPGLVHGENCVVEADPRLEQVSSESGSQVWARMNGVRFRNAIPPYTRDREFEITASGCVPGQVISLYLHRPWSRPWGLE